MTEAQQFTIRKKIAKHGNQSIIIVPKILENELKPGTIIDLSINVVGEE